MAKLDFNTQYFTSAGEPVRRPKIDKDKAKLDPRTGNPIFSPVTDADGNVVFEPVMVKDMIVQVLDHPFEGDDKLSFPERAKRGKLARKVADATKGSLKNYSTEELVTIKELTAKIGATSLLAQLEDIIEGTSETEAA